MDERSPAQVRTELGISMERIASLAGVDRTTVRIYEANPDAVRTEAPRAACAHVYRELERALQRIRSARSSK